MLLHWRADDFLGYSIVCACMVQANSAIEVHSQQND